MICGDMNSRSGCLQDYIDYDDNDDINSVLYHCMIEHVSQLESNPVYRKTRLLMNMERD